MRQETFEREQAARESITRFVAAKYPDHSERWHRGLAGMIVAERFAFLGWLGEIGSGDDVQLRQQQTASMDDPERVDEQIYEAQRVLDDLLALRTRIRRGHVDTYDPDVVGEREDDVRVSTQRADESAAAGMPKGIAS